MYTAIKIGQVILLTLGTLNVPVLGQTLKGKVVDDATNDALAYASIVITGRGIGGITTSDGQFNLDVSRADPHDTVRFSYIGYETLSAALGTMDNGTAIAIRLRRIPIMLNPVGISANGKTIQLGNGRAGSRRTGWGDLKSLRGRTRGLLIEGAECPAKVKSFAFRIDDNDWDSVAFRVNLLKVEGRIPGQSLLNESILIKTSNRDKWVKTDLSDHNIVICGPVIVTLEWVDAWGNTGAFSNLLTISLSRQSGYFFKKEPGQEFGTFEASDNTPAMYIEVYGD